MAAFVFNISKGKVNEYHDRVDGNDPSTAGLMVVLLKVAEADALLKDYDTLAAILAGSNTEANFTNYARKTLTDSDISASVVDDSNDRREADIPDQTWSSAGGASNNTLIKAIVCYVPSVGVSPDSAIIPLTGGDFSGTTNGGDIVLQVDTAGYFRAA